MVKSRERAAAKMERGVRAAGPEIKAGMQDATDPLDILTADPKKYGDKMVAGVQEAQRTGRWKSGLEKAKSQDKWKNSVDRASAHYVERAGDMVENSMSDYDSRASCIEKAQALVKDMPSTTRDERIAKSAEYQRVVGKEFDKLYNRTA